MRNGLAVADFAPKVRKILKENGYFYHGPGKGDHEKWRNNAGKQVIVDGKIRSRHTANEILKQAGLKKAF